MRFLVHTPYRCGSTFIAYFLKKNTGYDISWNPDAVPVEQDDIIFKCHYYFNGLKNRKIDYIFTSIRRPTEIFISAYIKDFRKGPDKFPYYYGREPSLGNLDDIVEHFLSFDWLRFGYLSYEAVFDQIKTISGMDIWNLDFDKHLGCRLHAGDGTKLVVATKGALSKKFCGIVGKELGFHKMIRGDVFFSNYRAHGELYKQFQERIPKTFFERYKDADDKVIDKFL